MRFLLSAVALSLAVAAPMACSPGSSTGDRTTPLAEAAFESPYFTVTVSGAGPAVIFIPGLASSAQVWDETAAALEGGYTVHAVQVSGFAGAPSRGNAGNTDILDDLASDVARYARTLDEPPSVIGHSLGGLVTLKAALADEAALKQIMVVDVLPYFSVLMDPNATEQTIAPIAAIMKATLVNQSEDVFRARQGEALQTLVKDPSDVAESLEWSVASDRAVMAQAMSEVLVTDLRPLVSGVKLPVTVLYARDPAIPNMPAVEQFYQTDYAPIEALTLIPIDGALHFIMDDQTERFIDEVKAFLAP